MWSEPATALHSYVPEATTAKRKPLIHAEAVALSNDTWQIHHEGESQPSSRFTVPAELPQSILPLLVSLSPNKSCSVYLGRCCNSAASIYWSQVDYRINNNQMDGGNQDCKNSQVWCCADSAVFWVTLLVRRCFHLPVLFSNLRHFCSGLNSVYTGQVCGDMSSRCLSNGVREKGNHHLYQ